MRFSLKAVPPWLFAELSERETIGETRLFLDALAGEAERNGCTRLLISVRTSRSIFRVDQYSISTYLGRVAGNPAARVALTADSAALRAAQQYVEVLARQQGARVRAFEDERAALEWLGEDLPLLQANRALAAWTSLRRASVSVKNDSRPI